MFVVRALGFLETDLERAALRVDFWRLLSEVGEREEREESEETGDSEWCLDFVTLFTDLLSFSGGEC